MPDFSIENQLEGLTCGVDEAGRGPLAGPVIACACVILDKDLPILENVDDSKKLTPSKRAKIFSTLPNLVQANKLAYVACDASVQEIEEHNILQATMFAMQKSVLMLQNQLAEQGKMLQNILIDGNQAPNLPQNMLVRTITSGDGKSISIALASIIAKEIRDEKMTELDKIHPEYGFAKHKGYGTKQHREAIIKYGATEHHRKLFLRKITG